MIDQIFENVNIYQSIILYNKSSYDIAHTLFLQLSDRDFPVMFYDYSNITLQTIQNHLFKYRMYFIPIENFYHHLLIWVPHFQTISLIITIGGVDVYKQYKLMTNISGLIHKDSYLSISI